MIGPFQLCQIPQDYAVHLRREGGDIDLCIKVYLHVHKHESRTCSLLSFNENYSLAEATPT